MKLLISRKKLNLHLAGNDEMAQCMGVTYGVDARKIQHYFDVGASVEKLIIALDLVREFGWSLDDVMNRRSTAKGLAF
jgi:hypothetical protein